MSPPLDTPDPGERPPRFSFLEFLSALRSDLLAFLERCFRQLAPGQKFELEWFLEAIAHELERVRSGKIRRLIVNLPPRSLKSMMVSVALPAYLLGHDPRRRIICVSYSNDLALKHAGDCRAIMGSDWYGALFPKTVIGAKDTQTEFTTTERGGRLTTSVGGTLTGRGGDLIIIDDPLKAQDAHSESERTRVNEWLTNTLLSRLDDKRTGAIIVVMQRVHMDDLSGHLIRESGEDWTVLSLPAIAEVEQEIPLLGGRAHRRRVGEVLSRREPLPILEGLKREMGSAAFQAQYQQEPVPPGGAMIKRSWVQRYTELPQTYRDFMVLQSWDTAAKGGPANDYSVCTTWLKRHTGEKFMLIDLWRGRVDYPGLKRKFVELAELYSPHQILVEESMTAIALIDEFKGKVHGITPIKPDTDKVSRMAIAAAMFESGQVFFPERAPWLADLEAELFAFPGGRHDDQVDSISQALLRRNKSLETWAKLGAQLRR